MGMVIWFLLLGMTWLQCPSSPHMSRARAAEAQMTSNADKQSKRTSKRRLSSFVLCSVQRTLNEYQVEPCGRASLPCFALLEPRYQAEPCLGALMSSFAAFTTRHIMRGLAATAAAFQPALSPVPRGAVRSLHRQLSPIVANQARELL